MVIIHFVVLSYFVNTSVFCFKFLYLRTFIILYCVVSYFNELLYTQTLHTVLNYEYEHHTTSTVYISKIHISTYVIPM